MLGGGVTGVFFTTYRKCRTRSSPVSETGNGKVTTRAHLHYLTPEFGTANLFGKNFKQIAGAAQKITHASFYKCLEMK